MCDHIFHFVCIEINEAQMEASRTQLLVDMGSLRNARNMTQFNMYGDIIIAVLYTSPCVVDFNFHDCFWFESVCYLSACSCVSFS